LDCWNKEEIQGFCTVNFLIDKGRTERVSKWNVHGLVDINNFGRKTAGTVGEESYEKTMAACWNHLLW
jgi:hypothetical protein